MCDVCRKNYEQVARENYLRHQAEIDKVNRIKDWICYFALAFISVFVIVAIYKLYVSDL
jgi:hypothetical protein